MRKPREKFAFGRNWSKFLATVNTRSMGGAEESLRHLLRLADLKSLRFLDAGSGSGLFSLAAYNLGATVTSFDADADSVACTRHLRAGVDAPQRWTVAEGSLLDRAFLQSLAHEGQGDGWDVVYCWGVAHHTGDMWLALENLTQMVGAEGRLALAIYNDQQYISKMWQRIKQIYQRLPIPLQTPYVLLIWIVLFARRAIVTLAACLLRLVTLRNPLVPIANWISDTRARGMNSWYDLVDWVGGWPFEVARPEEIFRFMRDRGFILREMTTSGGHGCNEFMFQRANRS